MAVYFEFHQSIHCLLTVIISSTVLNKKKDKKKNMTTIKQITHIVRIHTLILTELKFIHLNWVISNRL